jgi:hypothetical protein
VRGNFSALYLKGAPPGAAPCPSHLLGSGRLDYFEFAMVHELVHSLGFVPRCAPHARGDYESGHVTDSRFDLMWTGSEPWGTSQPGLMQLDVGRDDYFRANVPGCPDLSSSPYLASVHRVSVTVTGPGSVTSSPPGIDCPGVCTGHFEGPVTLTAAASEGGVFKGWTGACTGVGPCAVTGEGAVTAAFAVPSHQRSLTLRVRGKRATGGLRAVDGFGACSERAPVIVERRRGGAWSTVRRARTDGAGRFAVSIPAGRATYRARAPEITAAGQLCVGAVSRVVRAPA